MSNITPESRDYSFDQIEDDPRLKRTTKEFFITMCVYIIYGILMITNLFLFGQHSTLEAAKCETLPIVKELHIAEKAVSQAATELKKATEENSEAAEKKLEEAKIKLEEAKINLEEVEENIQTAKNADGMKICSMPSVHTTKPFGLPLWIFNLICLLIGMVVTVELVCKFGYKDMSLVSEANSKEAE